MCPQVAQNNKAKMPEPINGSSALTHSEWRDIVAQTAEIREAALLIKQAKAALLGGSIHCPMFLPLLSYIKAK